MLEYLRNASEKPVAKILIGLLSFSFVGWGVAEWVLGGGVSDTTLVRVGNQDVTMEQFNMERSREFSQMTKEQQRASYTDAAVAADLQGRILSKLTTQRMVENRAQDLGFYVTDARVAREIRTFPEFQFNGQFSTYLFDSVLANTGYSEADFAEILRGQVLRSMTLGAMSAPVVVPEFAAMAAYNARYATRDIEYATVDFDDFKAEKPTDDQLRQFYAARPHTVAEQRVVSYVLIPAEMSKPDEYDAAFATAQQVEDAIISGESFADAAKQNKAKFVSYPAFSLDKAPADKMLNGAMLARLFDMDEGLESELIETKDGFLIVRVDKIIPQHNAEFEDVKKNLISDWRRDAQEKQAYVRANEILVDLNQNGKFAGKKSATVTRASGAPDAVLVSAFNSEIGTASIVPGTDAFYVVRVTAEKAPKVDDKNMVNIRKELKDMSTRMITDDYNAFLIREYPVKVNEKVYNRFLKN